jgi:hypothetical protein
MSAIAHICDLKPVKYQRQPKQSTGKKKLKSPWNYGRAYLPAFCILIVLLLSLGVLHLHWLGKNLLQIPRRKFKKLRIVE